MVREYEHAFHTVCTAHNTFMQSNLLIKFIIESVSLVICKSIPSDIYFFRFFSFFRSLSRCYCLLRVCRRPRKATNTLSLRYNERTQWIFLENNTINRRNNQSYAFERKEKISNTLSRMNIQQMNCTRTRQNLLLIHTKKFTLNAIRTKKKMCVHHTQTLQNFLRYIQNGIVNEKCRKCTRYSNWSEVFSLFGEMQKYGI